MRITIFTAVVVGVFAGLIPLDEIAALANAGTLPRSSPSALRCWCCAAREPDRERLFRTPAGVGGRAPIGILGCIYLFISLPNRTQIVLPRCAGDRAGHLFDLRQPRGGAGARGDVRRPRRSAGPLAILPLFVAVLLIPAVLGSSKTIFNDGDVSWHIATGQWILDHRAIPHTDPFSFTWAGKPWVPIEWLAEVILRLARIGSRATAALRRW